MKKLLFIPVLLLVYSCSPALKIQDTYHASDIDFKNIKNSKIAIFGVNSITLTEFVNTFNDEYSDTAKLNNKILSTFSKKFKMLIPSVIPVEESEKIPALLAGEFSFKENNSEDVSKFFDGLETDYLIFVNNISVGNSYNSYMYSTGYGTFNSGATENCVVNMEIELWNVPQQKRLMKFWAGGDKPVVLFSYLSALNGAIENSVGTAVKYLKNNGSID